MKHLFKIFNFLLLILLLSCNESKWKSIQNWDTVNKAYVSPSCIIGKWKWIGSAIDSNNNGIADDGEWQFRNAKFEKEYVDLKGSIDDLEINFDEDLTGYVGKLKKSSISFTWQLENNGKGISIDDNDNKENCSYYFGKNGELIEESTGDVTSDFEKKQGLPNRSLTTYEMFKKQE